TEGAVLLVVALEAVADRADVAIEIAQLLVEAAQGFGELRSRGAHLVQIAPRREGLELVEAPLGGEARLHLGHARVELAGAFGPLLRGGQSFRRRHPGRTQ